MNRTTRLIDMKPPRGRPKGSGKDDWSRLQQIAALIAANPALKPTTAIKRIGVTDPSVIRRLRDKFHLAEDELLTTVRRTRASSPSRQTPKRGGDALRPRNPASATAPGKNDQTGQAAATCQPPVAAPKKTSPAPFGPFAALMGLSVQAATLAVEHHYTLCQYALRSPPIEAFVRQQLLITEMLFTTASPRPASLTLRH